MSEQDDFDLVTQCLEGNSKAFEVIVDRYQKPVFNVALRMLHDFEDAQDVAQSVFVKAYENLDCFNPKFKFFSWIYRMAVNESINFINKRKPLAELDHNAVSKQRGPEELYQELELSERIHTAIMELQVDYRAVMVLKHFEGFSYREISYILELPEKTVKSRLFTSRQLLRSILLKRGIVSQ